MNNQVSLTDDELSIVMFTLMTTLQSFSKYEIMSDSNLDSETIKLKEDARALYERLNKEYFSMTIDET